MADNDKQPGLGPDFMGKLRDSLGREPGAGTGEPVAREVPDVVKKYAPPEQRHGMIGQQSPLQIIASGVKRLVWDDAEHMAETVCKHLNGDHGGITGPVMAKAIQKAADELLKEGGNADNR